MGTNGGPSCPPCHPDLEQGLEQESLDSDFSEFGEVARRITEVQKDRTPSDKANLDSCGAVAAQAAAIRDEADTPSWEAPQPRLRLGFCTLVTGVIAAVAFAAFVSMFECALTCFGQMRLLRAKWMQAERLSRERVTELVSRDMARQACAARLAGVERELAGMLLGAQEAVETVWMALRAERSLREERGSERLLFLEWEALHGRSLEGVSLAFAGGRYAAARRRDGGSEFWVKGANGSYAGYEVDGEGNRGAFCRSFEGLPEELRCSGIERAWTSVSRLPGGEGLGLAWTAPMAYCGSCSCFEGVVSAQVGLPEVSAVLRRSWRGLQREQGLGDADSSIFIMDPRKGVLVGAAQPGALEGKANATESPLEVVRSTARAVLLMGEAPFFSYSIAALRGKGRVEACEPTDLMEIEAEDCRRVATLEVSLDERTAWLAVVVLPVNAFTKEAAQTYGRPMQDFFNGVKIVGQDMKSGLYVHLAICVAALVVSVPMGVALGHVMSRPLWQLDELTQRLGELDFSHDSAEWCAVRKGSCILEMAGLQQSFCSLSHGIEAFARFVPRAVVQNIVHGDEGSMRLHVRSREVTVLCSDIEGFTSISERLRQQDLLFLLTRYLTVMTRIVELLGGVVAEVLGDGLLCFWNTPREVQEHGAKACMAALAMQQALTLLNEDIEKAGLPCRLAVRIGIHTGAVLSGNIGSSAKMKFGCIGDPVDIAGRLEALCKRYGVPIICSSSTRARLPAAFVCRRLDLVRLGSEPLAVYEVMGRDLAEGEAADAVGDCGKACAALYEEALTAYQEARFTEASELLAQLLIASPFDSAAEYLRERAARNAGGLAPQELEAWTGATEV